MKKTNTNWVALIIAGLMTAIPFASAQEKDNADVTVVAEEGFSSTVDIPLEDDVSGDSDSEDLISVSFEDATLEMVVNVFAKWSGANIIAIPSNLQGRVTVSLENVEWKPALGAILAQHGLSLQEHTQGSKVFAISTVSPNAPPPMLVDSYFLEYASVSDLTNIIGGIISAGGTINPFPSRNILVVRSTEKNHGEIKAIINEIDIPREQVYIEAKVLELDETAIKDLGIDWQSLEGYTLTAGNLQYAYDESRGEIHGDTRSKARTDERTVVDHINQQFDIDGVQFEGNGESFFADAGNPAGDTTVIAGPLFPTRANRDDLSQIQTDSSLIERSIARVISDARSATLDASEFRMVLSALNQVDGVSFVSNPKIIVANEEQARIHIGEAQPNIVGSVVPGQLGQANTTVYNLDAAMPYFNFGITLVVTPTINTTSNITLVIEPTLSRFVRDVVAPDGNTFPLTSERTITTTFNLDSGRTAAIGGLTETIERNDESSIPLLGDIPLIGKYLFSHSSKLKTQRETIIFVTVGMANPSTMQQSVGLPGEARLAKKKMVQLDQRRRVAEEELDTLIKADEDMRKREVERKARLLDKQK